MPVKLMMLPCMLTSFNTETQLVTASLPEQAAVKNNPIRRNQVQDAQLGQLELTDRRVERITGLAIFLIHGRGFLADFPGRLQGPRS